jgi:hypothetical protein
MTGFVRYMRCFTLQIRVTVLGNHEIEEDWILVEQRSSFGG